MKKIVILLVMPLFCLGLQAQDTGYSNATELTTRINQLSRSTLAKSVVIGKSAAGTDIQAIIIANGKDEDKPALAILGGINGDAPLGQELALGFAESLITNAATDSIAELLNQVAFYIIPAVNPDATAQYFASTRYERNENGRTTDNDRDGRVDEDPFEDLNSDGLITMIRVKDPTGIWGVHPADSRVMIKRPKAGDRYHLYTEGIDNDKDGIYNEDGAGGVIFNKNLTYQHPTFKNGAGDFPVSEAETRAVLDYLYERWNVFAVVSLGASDNLQAPMKYNSGGTSKRIITSLLKDDAALNKEISESYAKETGLKAKTPGVEDGDFLQWAYFHYGRQSYGAAGWQVPEWKAPKDSTEAAQFKPNDDKNKEVDFLRWADSRDLKVFTSWAPVQHPDFPDKIVEVGGIHPFVKLNPPNEDIKDLVDSHASFIIELAGKAPIIALANQKVESIGNGVNRITIDVYNEGQFNAMTELGERNRWVKKPKISIKLADGQEIVGGKPVELLDNLKAGEPVHQSWLIKGKGTISISAGCAQTGTKQVSITLK
jgi:hypothetical protein